MLRETKTGAKQATGDPFRRWFSDDTFDLIVWHASDGSILGFQLCYRDGPDQKALTWLKARGFSHKRIDDGEGSPYHPKMTPILVPDGTFDKDQVLARFEKESRAIDPDLVRVVVQAIKAYPAASGRADESTSASEITPSSNPNSSPHGGVDDLPANRGGLTTGLGCEPHEQANGQSLSAKKKPIWWRYLVVCLGSAGLIGLFSIFYTCSQHREQIPSQKGVQHLPKSTQGWPALSFSSKPVLSSSQETTTEKPKPSASLQPTDKTLAFNSPKSPFHDYDKRVIAKIAESFIALNRDRVVDGELAGEVEIKFKLQSSGEVSDFQATRNTGNPSWPPLCIEAIKRSAPFEPFPEKIKAISECREAEIRFIW